MQKPTKRVIKNKLRSYILPVFSWITLEQIGKIFKEFFNGSFNGTTFVYNYASEFVYSFWFLWAMFLCSMIVLFVERVLKGKVGIYLILLIPMLFLPSKFNLYLYIYMYPYFVAGYLFNKYNGGIWYRKVVKKNIYSLLISVAVFVVLLSFYNHSSYIYTSKISLLGERGVAVHFGIDIFRWCIGFAGSVTFILLCKMICTKYGGRMIKLFAYLGQISLGIYILNSYTNFSVLLKVTKTLTPNILIWILETIVSMLIYIIAVEILKRIPIAKRLLLGGR